MGLLSFLFAASARSQVDFQQVEYSPRATDFKFVAAPDAKRVVLNIYDSGAGGRLLKSKKMKLDKLSQQWKVRVKGNLAGTFYTINVLKDGKWYGETPGVFAQAVGINGQRGAIISLDDTDPVGWNVDKRPALASPSDLVIYEMHHRDFSVSPTSSIKNKGKFLALTEPRAISHLTTLGINAVHILPSFDYASVDESQLEKPQYNWGYDPLNYNVPEGSYSTDPADPKCRINEFKQMVQALHKAGIRVILDVVYNHTFDIEGSAFQRTWPDYYYRKTADGQYSNGSGCGNETASDKAWMRKFIIESVKYWANEYHIDGFRFDLMAVHDIETMNLVRKELDKIDPSIFIYGEGWSAGSCAYPEDKLAFKANVTEMPCIAAFSDEIRDALRGPWNDDSQGAFIVGLKDNEESLKYGIAGCIDHPQIDMTKVNYSKKAWAKEPQQAIAYVSCHDDMCLVDRLKASKKGITEAELIRLDLLAQTAVFTSQGIPFMLSGEEMLRTKQGVHNSYNSPDAINQLDWDNLKRYPQVFNYYKGLISMRRNHPAFRLGSADLVRKHLEFLPTSDCLVAFRINGSPKGDTWKNITVVLNSADHPQSVSIPQGKYTVVCCDGIINENGIETIETDQIEVDPQTAIIMWNVE